MSIHVDAVESDLSLAAPPSVAVVIARYAATARHLRPRQALQWALRRSFGRRYRVAPDLPRDMRPGVAMVATAARKPSGLAANTFSFLNHRHTYGAEIDWHTIHHSRLWSYNLHYFDYALDPSRDSSWILNTIRHWIAMSPPSPSVAWEPYPVSLRIVNWIKFALRRLPGGLLEQPCRGSLFQQTGWLAANIEHEIQANHLLKNAKALIFGGAYFQGRDADRWLDEGLDLFLREVKEQVLGDGGHYERSAMYHAIVLEDLLDVIMLLASSGEIVVAEKLAPVITAAKAASSYLSEIVYPHGALPMFNDSAAINPDVPALFDYAGLVLDSRIPASPRTMLIDKAHSGYYGYRHDDEMMLVDSGPIGPRHQPGHGHCDTLSFELTLAGRPVIVDSGVYDYESTSFRQALRGTASHNTVRIDRREQSDIWGCFRVGRRAQPGTVGLVARLPEEFHFHGSHSGYRHLDGEPVHHREIDSQLGRSWRITDKVLGRGQHLLESFVHFHPDLTLRQDGDHWLVTDQENRSVCRIRTISGTAEIVATWYCPDFGICRGNSALRLSLTAELPASFGYLIEVA